VACDADSSRQSVSETAAATATTADATVPAVTNAAILSSEAVFSPKVIDPEFVLRFLKDTFQDNKRVAKMTITQDTAVADIPGQEHDWMSIQGGLLDRLELLGYAGGNLEALQAVIDKLIPIQAETVTIGDWQKELEKLLNVQPGKVEPKLYLPGLVLSVLKRQAPANEIIKSDRKISEFISPEAREDFYDALESKLRITGLMTDANRFKALKQKLSPDQTVAQWQETLEAH
jgi:hypothetical protein